MAESGWSGFFGFSDVLKGLPVVPKIIMLLSIVILLSGIFAGPFSLIRNPKLSTGAALFFTALGWRDFGRVPSRLSSPNKRYSPNYRYLFAGLFWFALSAGLGYLACCAS